MKFFVEFLTMFHIAYACKNLVVKIRFPDSDKKSKRSSITDIVTYSVIFWIIFNPYGTVSFDKVIGIVIFVMYALTGLTQIAIVVSCIILMDVNLKLRRLSMITKEPLPESIENYRPFKELLIEGTQCIVIIYAVVALFKIVFV